MYLRLSNHLVERQNIDPRRTPFTRKAVGFIAHCSMCVAQLLRRSEGGVIWVRNNSKVPQNKTASRASSPSGAFLFSGNVSTCRAQQQYSFCFRCAYEFQGETPGRTKQRKPTTASIFSFLSRTLTRTGGPLWLPLLLESLIDTAAYATEVPAP